MTEPGEMLATGQPIDLLADICGQVAGAFRRQWGRGPRKTSAHWADSSMLVVLLENGHTDAEKTMRAAGHIQQLLEGRQLLQNALQDELTSIVETATGRTVATVLSATRLDPDLSAEIFLFEEHRASQQAALGRATQQAAERARQLTGEAAALQAQARQAHARTDKRRHGH